jgi:hypothetical protein
MNSRKRISDYLNLKKVSENAATLEWWGMYKYEFGGLDYKTEMFNDGVKLADIYSKFYEYFRPDWFHLHIGTPVYFKDSKVIEEKEQKYLEIDEKYIDLKAQDKYFACSSPASREKIIDIPDYILGSKKDRPKVDISSKKKIDNYINKYVYMDKNLIIKLGYTDHVKEIAKKYGDDVFINVHIPSMICEILDPFTGYIGFEEGLISFHDWPGGMKYLMEKCYETQLEWVKAYKEAGAHGFCISEDNMAADSISPDTYRKFLKTIHINFFKEVRNIGLFALLTFWGDINPLLEDIKEIGINGLAIEESRKNYKLDVVEIMKKIGDSLCLFGNMDSVNTLWRGAPEDIREKIDYQKGAKNYGNFIFQNGSPITPGTPKENILELLNYARKV